MYDTLAATKTRTHERGRRLAAGVCSGGVGCEQEVA